MNPQLVIHLLGLYALVRPASNTPAHVNALLLNSSSSVFAQSIPGAKVGDPATALPSHVPVLVAAVDDFVPLPADAAHPFPQPIGYYKVDSTRYAIWSLNNYKVTISNGDATFNANFGNGKKKVGDVQSVGDENNLKWIPDLSEEGVTSSKVDPKYIQWPTSSAVATLVYMDSGALACAKWANASSHDRYPFMFQDHNGTQDSDAKSLPEEVVWTVTPASGYPTLVLTDAGNSNYYIRFCHNKKMDAWIENLPAVYMNEPDPSVGSYYLDHFSAYYELLATPIANVYLRELPFGNPTRPLYTDPCLPAAPPPPARPRAVAGRLQIVGPIRCPPAMLSE